MGIIYKARNATVRFWNESGEPVDMPVKEWSFSMSPAERHASKPHPHNWRWRRRMKYYERRSISFLPNGINIHPIAMTFEVVDMNRELLIRKAMESLGVPEVLIGDICDTHYASARR